MVLHNSLDYGFNGYQMPSMPRATRSARRKDASRSKVDDKQMYAFNLLASVAGNLLLERNPTTLSDTQTLKGHDQDCSLKEYFFSHDKYPSGFFPDVISYATMNTSTTKGVAETLTKQKAIEMKNLVNDVDFATHTKSCGHDLDGGNKIMVNDKSEKVMSGTDMAMCRSSDPVVCDWNPHMWVGSENGFKVPSSKDHGPQHPCPTSQEVGVRNDDNSSFGCIYPTTSRNSFRKAPCIRGHRIRKILASKNWNVAAKYGAERPKTGGYKRKFNFNRRNSYKNQRSQMNIPFKKRKLFDGCFRDCNGRSMVEKISDSNEIGRESSAHGKSSLVAGHQNSRVKLRIKSFRVPELFIEIPETATVSSLKRTVMEAVSTTIGRGIHVGVLLRGKKVRDDNKTLIQTGISHDNQDECLGFTLEPHSSKAPSSFCHGEPPPTFRCSSTLETINGCPPNPIVDRAGNNSTLLFEAHAAKLSNSTDTAYVPAPSLVDTAVEERSSDSKALVTLPAMAVETLTVVPVCQKSKQYEVGHRRMRRPFSVAEVEALVHAVETLGPGRWRDVKLRAFDNVKHRTYVDLKDKWKTLVHTAKISPRQRRGEQVPQQLLDRVLTAHAYWSQQQHIKHDPQKTCLLLP
ncbi:telomere repeat-binding protein 5-like isoform X1 [Cucurbita maxima]|uniref:Telomere repeat-binding protein 5-like isoform X1 n=2 Tax=Cucurbita maxima TaxID=3661 RepID=A0A6J1L7G5_CUCMA|nr:telomere repeat-binding protein 5-like isoform X1 [Cucurbita maxima]XP_023007356.1 telomere repeat-binding protein 5-like isoform X1 [Cucurbita maxima]XP_023007357.1 telomere repeat-binding protein 5-like isoform X1 [Cucurbita maxima]XP_023007358.1 telomere repeat-binding protein 5-like isoform X1 [Cucurbita maxima]XP_023007359.1 telomere repeat-binding protein 5-like isoform X1 [Cucurbita maxima]